MSKLIVSTYLLQNTGANTLLKQTSGPLVGGVFRCPARGDESTMKLLRRTLARATVAYIQFSAAFGRFQLRLRPPGHA